MARRYILMVLIVLFSLPPWAFGAGVEIGVFYYPGWRSDYSNWKDIKGTPDSRSPNVPWPDREPLLGYYPEEERWVAEKHIEWASGYGLTFFAYDWYWDGSRPEYNHALDNYLKAPNNHKLRFCLLWANHFPVPKNLAEFDAMVGHWIAAYFLRPTYYRLDDKPVIFLFSPLQLEINARKFGQSTRTLLARANDAARRAGHKGIYFVATVNDITGEQLERKLLEDGFNAYTGWNYVEARGARVDDYNQMVASYRAFYAAAARSPGLLPYLAPASPGWDSRPWQGAAALVRTDPTPEKFEGMLLSARELIQRSEKVPKLLMIEAWNEFAEGSYIEPTKKWGFAYLETIRKVFGSPTAAAPQTGLEEFACTPAGAPAGCPGVAPWQQAAKAFTLCPPLLP